MSRRIKFPNSKSCQFFLRVDDHSYIGRDNFFFFPYRKSLKLHSCSKSLFCALISDSFSFAISKGIANGY